MVSNPRKGPVYNLLWQISHSPLKILEFVQFVLLIWVLLQTLFGVGGFLPYGAPMVGVSKSLLLLAGLHALVIILRRERPALEWEMILPIPFLAYAWLHYQFISPTPWEAAPLLTVLVQAYVLFFIAFNAIHGRRMPKTMVYVVQGIVCFALVIAFLQFYLFPIWSPLEGRIRNPEYASGAAGFLQDPANLGILLIPFLPLCFGLVAKHWKTSPTWVLQSCIAVALVLGMLMCSHFWGLVGMWILVLAMPLYISGFWFRRRKLWKYLALIIPVFLFLSYFGTDELRDRILYYLSLPSDPLGSASLQVAFSQFADSPVLGQGLGSFSHNWESFVMAGVEGTSRYPVSTYAAILAELGLAGLFLAGLPVVFLLWRALREWWNTPFFRMDPDMAQRIEGMPPDHPMRIRAERHAGTMPTQKVFLGGLALGLVAMFYYAAWDYAFELPITLFTFAVLAACLAAFCRGPHRGPEKGWKWIVTALLPLLLASWSASFGISRFLGSNLVFTSEERLEFLLEEPDRIFGDPGTLSSVEHGFRLCTELDPGNADAWTGLGSAYLARLHASFLTGEEVAALALPALETAIQLNPQSWIAHYNLARALALRDLDLDRIRVPLEAAIATAPQRAEPPAFLGSLLLLQDSASPEGVEFIQKAISLDENYEPAIKTLELVQTGRAAPRRQGGSSSATHLVEQFRISYSSQERVCGAGLPEFNTEDPFSPVF